MMQPTKKRETKPAGVKFTHEDRKLADQLQKKLGLGISQILRLGLRALATKEGLTT